MILISHRGNIDGNLSSEENNPSYIDKAIKKGYDVEIDVWLFGGFLYLGHDNPQYKVDTKWIIERSPYLWVHCKNIDSVLYFNESGYDINYFWHQKDTLTLTSKKYIWVYPGNQPVINSIAVMPEIYKEEVKNCRGVCSDFISRYK